jgi:23S rRNA pseudouridine1911/1915/1917 synthase
MVDLRTSDLSVIRLDDSFIAVDKAPGIVVHAEPGRRSLQALVDAWLAEREPGSGPVLPVHRLDKDTSGVIVFARTQQAAAALSASFRERRAHKRYLALTWPVPRRRFLETELRLEPQALGTGEKMVVVDAEHRGRHVVDARSEIELLARGRRLGLVRVVPHEGRKHHVRVTLAHLGAPIVGDFVYGGRRVAKEARRIMLHARGLELAHPAGRGHLDLRAPLPEDFVERFRLDGGLLPRELDKRHRAEGPSRAERNARPGLPGPDRPRRRKKRR